MLSIHFQTVLKHSRSYKIQQLHLFQSQFTWNFDDIHNDDATTHFISTTLIFDGKKSFNQSQVSFIFLHFFIPCQKRTLNI
jgi:hypothetical protein